MFCPNCGKELKEGALFCPKCGTSIGEKKEVVNSNVKMQDNKTVNNLKNKKIPLVVFIVLPLLIIIVVLFIILNVLNSSVGSENNIVDIPETTIPLPTTVQNLDDNFDDREETTSIQTTKSYNVVETKNIQTTESYKVTETTKIQTTQNYNVVETTVTQTTVNIETSAQSIEGPTSAPEGNDNLEAVEPGQSLPNQVVDDGPQSGSAVVQQNNKTNDDVDEDSQGTKSDEVKIVELVEQTENLEGTGQIHIMEPVVECVTDTEMADNINSVLPSAVYEIAEKFNNLIVVEDKPVLSIILNNVTVNEGNKRVNFSYRGTLQYQDGTTKNVSASIIYTKADNTCKVTAQTS